MKRNPFANTDLHDIDGLVMGEFSHPDEQAFGEYELSELEQADLDRSSLAEQIEEIEASFELMSEREARGGGIRKAHTHDWN